MVEGVIDFSGLKEKVEQEGNDVLNGIAFDAEKKDIFCNWKKLEQPFRG